jgi:hypothetical protein
MVVESEFHWLCEVSALGTQPTNLQQSAMWFVQLTIRVFQLTIRSGIGISGIDSNQIQGSFGITAARLLHYGQKLMSGTTRRVSKGEEAIGKARYGS